MTKTKKVTKRRKGQSASKAMLDSKCSDVVKHAKELLRTMSASESPDANYWVDGRWNAEPAYHLRNAIKAFESNAVLSGAATEVKPRRDV